METRICLLENVHAFTDGTFTATAFVGADKPITERDLTAMAFRKTCQEHKEFPLFAGYRQDLIGDISLSITDKNHLNVRGAIDMTTGTGKTFHSFLAGYNMVDLAMEIDPLETRANEIKEAKIRDCSLHVTH